jgi:hypothetical protein
MAALFLLGGVLAGVAVYRYGEARATWRRVKDGKTSMRTNRANAWRHTGFATLYIAGAIFFLLILTKVFK